MIGVFLALLVPIGFSAARKLASTGQAGLLLTVEESGFRVRAPGTAESVGLRPGDLLLLLDGEEARAFPDPVRALEGGEHELTILRDGQPLRLKGRIGPSPWDTRYLLLLFCGAAFLVTTGIVLRTAPHEADPASHFLFAGFAFTAAVVLVVTPAPPYDLLFRATTLLEDVARAFLPAFLLAFVFRFPRRSDRVPAALFFVPALGLAVLALATYLSPPAPDVDATPLVLRLDRLQQAALLLGVGLAVVRLVSLATRRLDLLAEKQVRFLLAGTAGGLLPVVLLDFLPRLLGGPIPVVSSFSIVPLVLVPAAFLAALTRYRLWDVEILTRETVALLGAAFLGAGLFSLAQVADLSDVLPGIPYGRGLVEAGGGLLIALTFFPVRRGLSTALARVQYGERFGEREGLLALVRELSRPRRLSEIGPLLAERVMSGLGVPRATLLIALPDGRLDASTVDGGEPFSAQELPEGATKKATRLSRLAFNERPTVAVARTRRAGFRTIAPLALSGRLLGMFAVADRGGRDPLSGEDIELLETVLASAALAVDHARLYGELEAQAEQYRRLKEFHEDVVTGSPAAIVVTDDLGRISSVNPAFERLFGGSEGGFAGRLAEEVLPPAILSAGSTARLEVTLGHQPRVLDVAVSPFPGAREGSPARVWVLSDSTELARLEKSLAERDRLSALSNLSAGVAHEVNTPLTGVASFARLLLDDTPADDPRRPILEKIERQAFRAARLVGSLLDLARGRPREMASIEPASLVREAVQALEDEIKGRVVTLDVELPEALPRVLGHGDALVQVLVNLLKNALDAVSLPREGRCGPGVVRIAVAAAAGGSVRFTVGDDGPGLSRQEQEKIFAPFHTTKGPQGGVGLGLAIAGDIIRAHGGSFSVDSTPGQGARFTVSLPAAT
ncbi:MAG: PAS domain-containing protein [Holophagales bacterium]|nr:PAS domain-containing protein [Holophagales bacterium]